MEYIEVTGKSVEEAITNACTKLGIPSDKLDYEVIDKGNSGFLGIFNSKPAKIKAREKQEESVVEQVKAEEPKKSIEAPVHTEKKFEKKADNFKKAEPKKEFKAESKKEYKPADNHKKLLRLKKSLRQNHLQLSRRKLLRRIYRHSLIICLAQ